MYVDPLFRILRCNYLWMEITIFLCDHMNITHEVDIFLSRFDYGHACVRLHCVSWSVVW